MDLLPVFRTLIHATTPIPGVGDWVLLSLFRFPPPRSIPLSPPLQALWEARVTTRVQVGRHRVAVHRWPTPGARGRVLLAHGWAMNARLWMTWIDALRQVGLEPVALDFPAHGDSTGRRADPDLFGRALHAVLSTHGPFRASVGHSAGAAALSVVLGRVPGRFPVRRLVLLGAPASVDALFDYFQFKLGLADRSRALAESAFERRFGPGPRQHGTGWWLSRVPADVLLVHDTDDASVPVHNLDRILADGAQAEVVRTTGLGHQGIVQDPDVIARVVGFVGA